MYFAKLEMSADPVLAERAGGLATLAADEARRELGIELDDLAGVERVLEVLAARDEEPAPAELDWMCELYGSFLGQLVLARTGGSWAEGTLFGERIRGGMMLGPANLVFWPWDEARKRITGAATDSLEDRVRDLCERARATTASTIDRTYPFAADEGYFDAGVVRDGRLVLMATFADAVFGIFFAADGTFAEYVERQPADDATLAGWKDELGFEPRAIRVCKFELPDQGLGIGDLPWHYAEFQGDPNGEPDPDERAHLLDGIRRWLVAESFVLYWGNDLWLDGEGHVTSS